jgi:hypothetical protein
VALDGPSVRFRPHNLKGKDVMSGDFGGQGLGRRHAVGESIAFALFYYTFVSRPVTKLELKRYSYGKGQENGLFPAPPRDK